jgi:hypothetical protein
MEKKLSFQKQLAWLRICIFCFLLTILSLFLFSFTVKQIADDFLKQLGITQITADEKISTTMLEGSFDAYGVKKAKLIPVALRSMVAKDAFAYAKKHVSGASYIRQYNILREKHKPVYVPLKTPDQLMQENIAEYKKSVLEAEKSLQKADASMKGIFEKILAETKKRQLEAEDPNNKQYVTYRKNYEGGEKTNKQNHERMLAEWEQKYPADHMLFIKKRLLQFMQETEGIDFAATTTLKNGKYIFDNPQYERKSNRWKMSYRAGKEVVETSRAFVEQWLSEISKS